MTPKFYPVIEPKLDATKFAIIEGFNESLTLQDIANTDDPQERIRKALRSSIQLDIYKHLVYVFYIELNPDILEQLLNSTQLEVSMQNGFALISGNLITFEQTVITLCSQTTNDKLRVIGNLLYQYFKAKQPSMFVNNKMNMLSDKTFALVRQ